MFVDRIIKWKWWLFGIILLGILVSLFERWRTYREDSQDRVILAAAKRYQVAGPLIKAVIWRESWFNPNAKGKSGEVGLMQIREETAREWARAEGVRLFTVFQMFDPVKNTLAGAWYLRKWYWRYAKTDNPLPYALAAYNAGPANAARWASKGAAATNSAAFIQAIDFPSTKKYVTSVMKRYEYYRTRPLHG